MGEAAQRGLKYGARRAARGVGPGGVVLSSARKRKERPPSRGRRRFVTRFERRDVAHTPAHGPSVVVVTRTSLSCRRSRS